MLSQYAVLGFIIIAFAQGKSKYSCTENQFPCEDGKCIDKARWCDSSEDCRDDSDELYCSQRSTHIADPNKCNSNYFLCHDGPCIPIVGRCDGFASCRDQSDEKDCGTTVSQVNTVSNSSVNDSRFSTVSIQPVQTKAPRLTKPLQHTNFSHLPVLGHMEIHDILQSDSAAKTTVVGKQKDVDILQNYVDLDPQYFTHENARAQSWLLSFRDEDYGWGDETNRAIIALSLFNSDFMKRKNVETLLMSKQLHLKLSMELIRNQTNPMPLSELALYINALLAACENPHNFHGHDLLDILRQRTNVAQAAAKSISPLVYLTLCISNSTTHLDLPKLQEVFNAGHEINRLGVQALASLAATCISSVPKFSSNLGRRVARKLFNKVTQRGLPGNIYDLSLVVQALDEARINQDLWNRSDALHLISSMQQPNGSFGDILSTYFTAPVLSGRSLIALAEHCYSDAEKDMVAVNVLMNGNGKKEFVQYSLYFGNPVEVTQTIRIKVETSSSVLDIMRIAAVTNSIYKFKYDRTRGRLDVYSIGDVANDAEQGLYWILHISSRQNTTEPGKLVPFEGDIATHVPHAGDHIAFWLKDLY